MWGGLVITIGMMFTRAIEVTPMNFELSLGALLTTQIDAVAWVVGFAAHLAISGAIAFLYAAGFRAMHRSSWSLGFGFGAIHWVISGILMGLVPRFFSLVPGIMEPPGFFGANFGPVNFLGNLVVHLLYGSVVGGMYASYQAGVKPAEKPEEVPTPRPGELKRVA
jgi:hypothetical protein